MAAIDAKEEHDILLLDLPNAFFQAEVPRGKGGVLHGTMSHFVLFCRQP